MGIMDVDHRIGFPSRWPSEQQTHLSVADCVLGEIIVHGAGGRTLGHEVFGNIRACIHLHPP